MTAWWGWSSSANCVEEGGGAGMLLNELQTYVDAASDDMDIGVLVRSIETGDEIALTYDVVADISEYGELIISVVV
jgi:hypothetical protein